MADKSKQDQFTFFMKIFKAEEKKLRHNHAFEKTASKFWALFQQKLDGNCRLRKADYFSFMKCVYKFLLPNYKEEEIEAELENEEMNDSISYNMFCKILFRVAHFWAVNNNEYQFLLNKIYDRITFKTVIDEKGNRTNILPNVIVSFEMDDRNDTGGEDAEEGQTDETKEAGASDDWMECKSDESNKSDHEYKYEEDEANMVLKKYKKPKNPDGGDLEHQNFLKEPLLYRENIEYDFKNSQEGATIIDELIDFEYVLPLGYPTEQYMNSIKNSVFDGMQEFETQQKTEKHLQSVQVEDFPDKGMLSNNQGYHEFKLFTDDAFLNEYTLTAEISDATYNKYRISFRHVNDYLLRMTHEINDPHMRPNTIQRMDDNEPIVEISKVGYNPVLDRRIKLIKGFLYKKKVHQYLNENYIVFHDEVDHAIKCSINKVENQKHLVLKTPDYIPKIDEFNSPETSFRETKLIMLRRKFESLFVERCKIDEKEQKRMQKIQEREEKKKQGQLQIGGQSNQRVLDSHEDKSLVSKIVRGPFHYLQSRVGIKQDAVESSRELITCANENPPTLLIVGKPRSGKTSTAKAIAATLDIVYISIETFINPLLKKIAEYEVPDDISEGKDPPKFLSDFEEELHQTIQNGQGPSDDQIVEILKQQITSPTAQTKGFVLDLPYYKRNESWTETLKKGLLGVEGRDFSFIFELYYEDEDIKMRADGIRFDPVSCEVVSKWERVERKKPKKKKKRDPDDPDYDSQAESEEEEEEDPDDDDPENPKKPRIHDEDKIVRRIQDSEKQIYDELQHYHVVERPAFDDILLTLYDNQYWRIDAAGLTPEQITNSITEKVKGDEQLRPLAIALEGEGDNKSYLMQGKDEIEDVGKPLARRWSLWQQTDPVALYEGQVRAGETEFAASYNDQVFLFQTEENQKKFVENPKIYLQKPPEMPQQFRVLVLGPSGSGKRTIAQQLSDKYGWKVADMEGIINDRIEDLKSNEFHQVNNPQADHKISMQKEEWMAIQEGKPLDATKILPWFWQHLDYPLEKKRPPPVVEAEGEDGEGEDSEEAKAAKEVAKKAEEEAAKKAEEDAKKKKKKKKKKGGEGEGEQADGEGEEAEGEEEEEEIILDDLLLEQVDLKFDEETDTQPFVGGFIMMGYPETPEQLATLLENRVMFDKILVLQDTDEDNPGKLFADRKKDEELYNPEWETENMERVLGFIKEGIETADDIIAEISCNGTEEEVFTRVISTIDPFFIQLDNEENVRVTGDLDEETDKPLPRGEYGNYCPITFVNDSWLYPGDPEKEVQVKERVYRLAGEKEEELFKADPMKYIFEDIKRPPQPHIMFIGPRGSGVSTQIQMICEKYKLSEFGVKQAYLETLKAEKEKRKTQRLLARGFKAPEPVEEGEEPEPDPEIEEDPDEFDKAAHEKEVLRMVLDPSIGQVYDGDWFDIEEGTIETPLVDLLFESRRPPEVLFTFTVSEDNMMKRCMDEDAITEKYEDLCRTRQEEMDKQRGLDREEKVKEMAEDEEKPQEEKDTEMQTWDEERAEQEAGEENPYNLEEMINEEKDKLKARLEEDNSFLEEFLGQIAEKGVKVIKLSGDLPVERVNKRLLSKIHPYVETRNSLLEREMVTQLNPKEVQFYEQSYLYKKSKFGNNSLFNISNPQKNKENSLIYRDKLYYFTNNEERENFSQTPDVFIKNDTLPLDLNIKPMCFAVGPPSSGKTTACQRLSEKIGIVHLQLDQVIQDSFEIECVQGDKLRQILGKGEELPEDLVVQLVAKRIQHQDCIQNGFIIEDFPKTQLQALALTKLSIVPNFIFSFNVPIEEIYKRTQGCSETEFGCDRLVLSQRTMKFYKDLPDILSFYQMFYSNVKLIDGLKSKWSIEKTMINLVEKSLNGRTDFARRFLDQKNVCVLQNVTLDRSMYKFNQSEFLYYCPVTWKNHKIIKKCSHKLYTAVLYDGKFFFFNGEKERDIFLTNPDRFLKSASFPASYLPRKIRQHKASEIVNVDKSLNGYCPVTLVNEQRLVKGYQLYLTFYKEHKYVFESELKMQQFLQRPYKYEKVSLPVKMPPPKDKITLLSLSELENSIPFLEQSIGQIATRALLEVGCQRLKYPSMSTQETSLKLYALFLKANNPTNTEFLKKKYRNKIKQFVETCEMPQELYKLYKEREVGADKWNSFKEKYYHEAGAKYDRTLKLIDQQRSEKFLNYIR